ncbi:MAG: transporter substrate-binding domain-containing protein, partial [Simkaniaceae bacterium]|nr:transporter substrate-binding domain-containing protein [Simkaniaceae bacterium]
NMVNEALLTEHAAGVIPRDVPTIAQALLDVKNGLLDGAFIERISAEGFVNDLYAGELHIVTDPIGDSGLRFVTLHDENEKWITVFNEGLKKLIHSGKYQKILDKWHL